MSDTEIAVAPQDRSEAMTLQSVKRQINLIQEVMRSEMKDGEHYGKIPGCGEKPALLKAGAEKLSLTFRMAPKFEVILDHSPNGHREYRITTSLYHIDSGKFLGSGMGSGSTMESKYRYREDKRKCPKCGSDAIIKGKQEYGGGWICFAKKNGCGAKFSDTDSLIVGQKVGKVENQDIADIYNTVLKMAKKRSLVDAVLTVTAASDIFTQDIEELGEEEPATKPIEKPSGADRTINLDESKLLHARIDSSGLTKEDVKTYCKKEFNKESSKDLTVAELSKLLRWLEQDPEVKP